jgi:photosystem II stability/assembly factor-like uncharacterized protein
MSASGQWMQQNSGTYQTLRGFHFFDSNTGIVYGNNGIILRTTNSGVNWVSYPTGITDDFTFMNFVDNNTGYITGYNNILKTTNRGINWTIINFGASTGFRSIAFFDINTGYLFGQQCDNTYRTTNGGTNWTQQCANPPQYGASNYYCAVRINDTLILAGGSVTQQNQSPGASFFKVNRYSIASGVTSGIGTSIGGIIMAGNSGIGYAMKSGTVLKTTNFGLEWSVFPLLWGGMSFYNENLGLLNIKQGNFFRISYSTNQGTTWILKDSVLSYNNIYSMKYITPNIVVAVGDSGKILRNNSFTIGIQNISREIPSSYSLGQNYPNPFNSSSKFKFEISKLGNVKIVVYDIQGRNVQTLVNDRLQPGTYETTFDGSMLTSGVYFYRMVTKDFTEVKKMLTIK